MAPARSTAGGWEALVTCFPIFVTLWEPLGPLVSQFSQFFSQFQQVFTKKTASEPFIIKKICFFVIFHAPEH